MLTKRGAIERRFSFLKIQEGLSLVRAKTAESIAVTVDIAIINADLDLLLSLVDVPILLMVKSEEESIIIRIDPIEKFQKSVA